MTNNLYNSSCHGMRNQLACFREIVDSLDESSLHVIDALNHSVNEIRRSGVEDYDNAAIIFFHELQWILTAFVYRIIERKWGLVPEQLAHTHLRVFPYADFQTASGPINPDLIEVSCQDEGVATRSLKDVVTDFVFTARLGREVVLKDVLISRPKLYAQGYRVRVDRNSAAVCKSIIDQQWPTIAKALSDSGVLAHMPQGLERLLHAHIQKYSAPSGSRFRGDALVCGSITSIGSRVAAAAARKAGRPVITVLHGGSDGVLDEPNYGYGEYAFATHLISYGSHGEILRRSGRYAKPITGQNPRAYARNFEDLVYASRNSCAIEPVGDVGSRRILYVPTQLSYWQVYGPFRSLPAILYEKWGAHLVGEFNDLYVKVHPKEMNERIIPIHRDRVVGGWFRNCLEKFDVFFFDYVSTAFTLAAATDKPIVFFDIGLNCLSEQAKAAVVRRCIIVRVDDLNSEGLARIISESDGVRYNEYTEMFCTGSYDSTTNAVVAAMDDIFR